MEDRIAFLMFGAENDRQGTISTLQWIISLVQLSAEQEKLLMYNRVLDCVESMTDKEFEAVMSEMKTKGVSNHE